MRPARFSFFKPSTLAEASQLLSEIENSKLIAGGQTLIPLMKLRLSSPKAVISLQKISELQPRIDEISNTISIGALTTHDLIHNSDIIKTRLPILSISAGHIADQQIRNRGTIGGNIAHGDPLANLAVAALCLKSKVVAFGSNRFRRIELVDFFVGLFETALKPEEILVMIEIEYEPDLRTSYLQIAKTPGTWPLASAGFGVKFSDRGLLTDARIALGGASEKPMRIREAEQFLKEKGALDFDSISRASEIVCENINPEPDTFGSRKYKLNLFKVITQRGLASFVGEKIGIAK